MSTETKNVILHVFYLIPFSFYLHVCISFQNLNIFEDIRKKITTLYMIVTVVGSLKMTIKLGFYTTVRCKMVADENVQS